MYHENKESKQVKKIGRHWIYFSMVSKINTVMTYIGLEGLYVQSC